MQDIVILDGARTPIGTFGGALANTTPIDLASSVTKVAMERSGVEGQQIGHVAFGHVIIQNLGICISAAWPHWMQGYLKKPLL